MSGWTACPRCGQQIHRLEIDRSWLCSTHGVVQPVWPVEQPTSDLLHRASRLSRVPVWVPWPLPTAWLVTGTVAVGDDPTAARAVAVACSGPAPLGGLGELVVVAEEPGVGLGARFAGIDEPDPGPAIWSRPADARLVTGHHPAAMWSVGSNEDRVAFVGEAAGLWLWAVLWPADTGYLVAEDLRLLDLREAPDRFEIPCGALTPRLVL
jgi:hypothetical protein